jgi:hypothetical protein
VSFLMNPKKNRKILAYPALDFYRAEPIPGVSKSAGMSGAQRQNAAEDEPIWRVYRNVRGSTRLTGCVRSQGKHAVVA